MRIHVLLEALILVALMLPCRWAAAFGMGGVSVGGVGMGMSGPSSMANGGIAGYTHGSPAATNPAVAMIEARQRQAQVAAEIAQARSAGRNVRAAEADQHSGEAALKSARAYDAMVHFGAAEEHLGIVSNTAAMGSYTKSVLGSVTSGGTDLSGAVVH